MRCLRRWCWRRCPSGQHPACRWIRKTLWPTTRTFFPPKRKTTSMKSQSACPMPAARRSAFTRSMSCWATRQWKALPTMSLTTGSLALPTRTTVCCCCWPPMRPMAETITSCAAPGWKAACPSARWVPFWTSTWSPIGLPVITTPAPKRPCRRWPTGCAASTV